MSQEQLALFDHPDRGGEGYAKFKAFHLRNPKVYGLFERFARSAMGKGNRHKFGARMIGERIRWYSWVETNDSSGDYRVNDHYWPYYARLLMILEPEFAEFFSRRNGAADVTDEMLKRECGRWQ